MEVREEKEEKEKEKEGKERRRRWKREVVRWSVVVRELKAMPFTRGRRSGLKRSASSRERLVEVTVALDLSAAYTTRPITKQEEEEDGEEVEESPRSKGRGRGEGRRGEEEGGGT